MRPLRYSKNTLVTFEDAAINGLSAGKIAFVVKRQSRIAEAAQGYWVVRAQDPLADLEGRRPIGSAAAYSKTFPSTLRVLTVP
jgi:hypothetical protein